MVLREVLEFVTTVSRVCGAEWPVSLGPAGVGSARRVGVCFCFQFIQFCVETEQSTAPEGKSGAACSPLQLCTGLAQGWAWTRCLTPA